MSSNKPWSAEELLRLKQLWLNHTAEEISLILDRTPSSISTKASMKKFKRSKEFNSMRMKNRAKSIKEAMASKLEAGELKTNQRKDDSLYGKSGVLPESRVYLNVDRPGWLEVSTAKKSSKVYIPSTLGTDF